MYMSKDPFKVPVGVSFGTVVMIKLETRKNIQRSESKLKGGLSKWSSIVTTTNTVSKYPTTIQTFLSTRHYYLLTMHAMNTLLSVCLILLLSADHGSAAAAGKVWTEDTSVGATKDWRGITSSADGTKLAATMNGGNIWTSSNSGANWTEVTSVGATKDWRGMHVSPIIFLMWLDSYC